jgi:APA family basic amino acid/polyamine antiporter
MNKISLEFKRELSLIDSTMIVAGSMIGSGIFIVSSDIARTVGAPAYLLLVWIITGLVTLVAALSYGELAGMMPRAGGQYIYLREAYNPLTAFLYGWTFFMVIQTGTIAAVAVAFAKFTAVIIPWFGEKHILCNLGGIKISAAQFLAIASIAFLTYLNTRGLHQGKIVQNIFTAAKITVLLGLILAGIMLGRNPEAISLNWSIFWKGSWTHLSAGKIVSIEELSGLAILPAIGVAMVGSLFSSDAWNNITFTAGEVVNPRRTIPLSLVLGTGLVTALYVLTNVVFLLVLPVIGTPDTQDVLGQGIQFAAEDRVGIAAGIMIFGEAAVMIMAALIMISTFGCNNGLILAGARVYYAMAQDGLFFGPAGSLNRKSVPGNALVVQGFWAGLLCLSGTYGDLLDYVIFSVLIFYILTVTGIFRLRKKRPDTERPYRAYGYPFLPALYILVAAAISFDLLVLKPKYTWPGLIIVIIGIPVYYVWKSIKRIESPAANRRS